MKSVANIHGRFTAPANRFPWLGLLAILPIAAPFAQDTSPKAVISNGTVRAEVVLPDPGRGSYRGTRSDWAGIVSKPQLGGHHFVAPWHEYRGPTVHDDVTAPAEEFLTNDSALGYLEAPPGGVFPRIGVGALLKPDEKAYSRIEIYDIADPGKFTILKGKDRVEFIHRLNTGGGYSHVYRGTPVLPRRKTRLEVWHALKNTGSKIIATVQYDLYTLPASGWAN